MDRRQAIKAGVLAMLFPVSLVRSLLAKRREWRPRDFFGDDIEGFRIFLREKAKEVVREVFGPHALSRESHLFDSGRVMVHVHRHGRQSSIVEVIFDYWLSPFSLCYWTHLAPFDLDEPMCKRREDFIPAVMTRLRRVGLMLRTATAMDHYVGWKNYTCTYEKRDPVSKWTSVHFPKLDRRLLRWEPPTRLA